MEQTVYFVTGSQDLYGKDTLEQVAEDSRRMAESIDAASKAVRVVWQPVVKNPEQIAAVCVKANTDPDCVGIITWMHTFSPAKMWIGGLRLLTKPMLHLHTQFNEKLPYDTIDMDFMNCNQSAHGDREFGFIGARLRMPRKVVAGFYRDPAVLEEIFDWAAAACAYRMSRNLKVCRFGDNMRDVAVTEGDKVEAQMRFGWQVDYYGVGDLVEEIGRVTSAEVDALMTEYGKAYRMGTDRLDAVREQAKYEIAIRRFLDRGGYRAFTTNFQDLHGLKQLPGLAVQRLMAAGYGFGGEGDWKTAALGAVLQAMGEGKPGATGFMEDYTYDLTPGKELVLAAHMLEVSPLFASTQPRIEVHPLSIGGREDPARLVFDGVSGAGAAVTVIDMGDRFRMIIHEIELVPQPAVMPKLPVARVMWRLKPDFKTGAKAWIHAGGAHHTVVTTQLRTQDLIDLAAMWDMETVVIDEKTEINRFVRELTLSDAVYKLKGLGR